MGRFSFGTRFLSIIVLTSICIILILVAPTAATTQNPSHLGTEVVWSEVVEDNEELFYSRLEADGWLPKHQLTLSISADVSPVISTGADGITWVVWCAVHEGRSALTFTRFNGVSWSPAETINTGMDWNSTPSIAISADNTPWVVWAGSDGIDDEIYITRWSNGGWDLPQQVNPENETPDLMPIVTLTDQNQPIVYWSEYSDSGYIITAAEKDGDSWSILNNAKVATPTQGALEASMAETLHDLIFSFVEQLPNLPVSAAGHRTAAYHIPGHTALQSLSPALAENLTELSNDIGISGFAAPRALSTSGTRALSSSILRAICFGNSITQGVPYVGAPPNGARVGGYETTLESLFEGLLHALNYGWGGESSANGLNRLRGIVVAVSANYVLIMEGTNDYDYGISPGSTRFNLEQMIIACRNAGKTPIIGTLPPDWKNPEKEIDSNYNSQIRSVSAQYGVPLADHHNALSPNWAIYTHDGKHPNSSGYALMARIWFNAMGGAGIVAAAAVPPDQAVLVSPSGTIAGDMPTFVWQALDKATQYYLLVQGPNGYQFEMHYDAAAITSGSTCSVSMTVAFSQGTYTWLVRGLNQHGYGAASTAFTFVVPDPTKTVPGPAILLSPSGTIAGNMPTLSWHALTGATHYYVYIQGPGYVFEQLYEAGPLTSGTTCSVTPTAALAQGSYIWLVHGYNDNGFGPWVQPFNFTVTSQGGGGQQPQEPATPVSENGTPGPATLLSPSGTTSGNPPTFTWQVLAGATHYYIYIEGPEYIFEQVYEAGQVTTGNTCSLTLSTALAQGTYIWLVHGYNQNGYGPWVQPLSFTVTSQGDGGSQPQDPATPANENGAPGPATLLSPSGNTNDNPPTFTWQVLAGATHYYIYIEGTGYIFEQVFEAGQVTTGNTCSLTLNTALVQGTYIWLVHGYNQNGFGPWIQPMSFTVKAQERNNNELQQTAGDPSEDEPPGPATLLSPSGGTTESIPTLTWQAQASATHYYIYIEGPAGFVYELVYEAGPLTYGTTCSLTLDFDLDQGAYIWLVHGYNENGYGPWVTPMAFNII